MAIEKFHFVTAVWGVRHLQTFIDIGLPSLLASHNIPNMQHRAHSKYHIFTQEQDLLKLQNSAVYQLLCDLISVEISLIDQKIENPHIMMSNCHREGMRQANLANAATVFIPPECLWSNGSLTELERIAATGISMVHIIGPRVDQEQMIEIIKPWKNENDPELNIDARKLVSLGLTCLHPITEDLFYREKSQKLMPANLLWSIQDQGILARCFHLHPLLVEANAQNTEFKTTIDDDLSLALDRSLEKSYVVTDSDQIFALELSHISHTVGANYEKNSMADIAAWAEVGANPHHRELVKIPIRIHHVDIDPTAWQEVEQEASQVVSSALGLLQKSLWFLIVKGLFKNVWHRAYAFKLNRVETKDKTKIMYIINLLTYKFLQILVSYTFMRIRWKIYQFFHVSNYYRKRIIHILRHYGGYYIARMIFHIRFFNHRALHYYGYYIARMMFHIRFFNHRALHYSGYYIARMMFHIRFFNHRALHYRGYYIARMIFHIRFFNHRALHYSGYYIARMMFHIRFFNHRVLHYSGYYIARVMFHLRFRVHILVHQLRYYGGKGRYYISRLCFYLFHPVNLVHKLRSKVGGRKKYSPSAGF